jgi:parvulin-like peptidyl-prolyl isomerase
MKKQVIRAIVGISLLTALSVPAFAADPSDEELSFYAAQRHRVEYAKLDDKQKAELKNDFAQFSKVADMVLQKNLLKDDKLYAVAQRLVAFDIWSQRFSQSVTPTEAELKKLYDAQEPKVSPRFHLYNFLTKDEKRAADVVKAVSAAKGVAKKIDKFKALASSSSDDFMTRSKGGEIGWVDTKNLDKGVQDALAGKGAGSVVKVKLQTIGWQGQQ